MHYVLLSNTSLRCVKMLRYLLEPSELWKIVQIYSCHDSGTSAARPSKFCVSYHVIKSYFWMKFHFFITAGSRVIGGVTVSSHFAFIGQCQWGYYTVDCGSFRHRACQPGRRFLLEISNKKPHILKGTPCLLQCERCKSRQTIKVCMIRFGW